MPVGRDHAPAQHMGSGRQARRRGDGHRRVLGDDSTKRRRLAAGTDETHHQRRDRLVEGQGQHRRRRRHHRAVGGLRLDQRGMRMRLRRMRDRDQQRQDGGNAQRDDRRAHRSRVYPRSDLNVRKSAKADLRWHVRKPAIADLRWPRDHVTSSAGASAPVPARDNRRTICPRRESRSSDECPSRIPAPPGHRASGRLRDRPQGSR